MYHILTAAQLDCWPSNEELKPVTEWLSSTRCPAIQPLTEHLSVWASEHLSIYIQPSKQPRKVQLSTLISQASEHLTIDWATYHWPLSIWVSKCLSIRPSECPTIQVSEHLTIQAFECLSIWATDTHQSSIQAFKHLSIWASERLRRVNCQHLSVKCPTIWLGNSLLTFKHLSMHLTIWVSECSSVWASDHPSIQVSDHLSDQGRSNCWHLSVKCLTIW